MERDREDLDYWDGGGGNPDTDCGVDRVEHDAGAVYERVREILSEQNLEPLPKETRQRFSKIIAEAAKAGL